MNQTEKQIFCADANICAILAKCNSQNKWELWGLSDVSETGEAKYETRLFTNHEFDDVEPINTTNGHSHIRVLNENIWDEIVFIEHKKAINKPIEPEWSGYLQWEGHFPRPSMSKSIPYLRLRFSYEDENESIESLVERGAGKNHTVLIDQIETVRLHESEQRDERLMAVIDYFLKNGIDINAKDEWGETALMSAAHSSTDVVNLLLQNGANINDKDHCGTTAIWRACNGLNIDVVKLLLANGAEVDSQCFLVMFRKYSVDTNELQILIELSQLLFNKNINVDARNACSGINDSGTAALSCVAKFKDPDNCQNFSKFFLEKQIALLEFLLDNGADINAVNNKGKTALMYAVKSENKHIAEYLLEHGADANIKDNAGNTALTYAQINSVRIIGKLRKKMDVKQASKKTYKINNNAIPNQGKTLNLYQFTYHIIPYLANEVFTGNLSYDALNDKDWIIHTVEQTYNVSFNWADFEVNNIQKIFFEGKSSILMILYTFPEPSEISLAKFALLTIDIEDKDFGTYYTLEKTDNDNIWMMCGVEITAQAQDNDDLSDTLYTHLNFGPVRYEATAENFMRDVFMRMSDDNRKLGFLKYIKDDL